MALQISLSIDGTAVTQVSQLCTTHGGIMGFAHPHHFIQAPDNAAKEQIQNLLAPSDEDLDDRSLAAEVKVVGVSIQNPAPGLCPFFALCGRPQTRNGSSKFNYKMKQRDKRVYWTGNEMQKLTAKMVQHEQAWQNKQAR